MKSFVVGGAVRDRLLGLPVQDRDHVVIGATPEQMLAQGFRPVGKDFPVFLHPQTSEEYALARTERKTAPGYKGFLFHAAADVTLEEDLVRRDLTINAIAETEDGSLIDPFGGQHDLEARVFRHVSDAFAEDPVRILRLARFAARFADFTVAAETEALMRTMVLAGEVDALVPERVWQELSRGLMEQAPSRMFEVLRRCGALARILPELDRLWGVPQPPQHHPEIDTGVHVMMVVDMSARLGCPLPVRFAALLHDLGKGATPASDWPRHYGHEASSVELADGICHRLKIPGDCRALALMAAREHGNVGRALELRPGTIVKMLERCDAFRKPERFIGMLQVAECDHRGRTGFEDRPFPQKSRLEAALLAARAVDAGTIAKAVMARKPEQPEQIPLAIHQARIAAVAIYLKETTPT
ncbi:MAG: multifunctional CCA addition/repair protein [Noviherbaspirillum sp.]